MIKGTIYAIVKKGVKLEDADGDIYIGSTTSTLHHRFASHKLRFIAGTILANSKILFAKYGVDMCEIIKIASCLCKDKIELRKREGQYQRTIKCVNRCIAGRSKQDYYAETKEKTAERYAEHRKANRQKNREYSANYYHTNKDEISEKTKIKITCECGSIIRKSDICAHRKTKKHITLMERLARHQ